MLSGCEKGLRAHIGYLKRSLNTVRKVIVLPHCGIKSKPLYFLPAQSPNTDTGTSPIPTTGSVCCFLEQETFTPQKYW